jgi:hypothetical protein
MVEVQICTPIQYVEVYNSKNENENTKGVIYVGGRSTLII